jgi:hypothetical protein
MTDSMNPMDEDLVDEIQSDEMPAPTALLPSDASLSEAKRWLRDRYEKGAACPCCNQHTKLYKRPLNKSMAYVLTLIAKFYDDAEHSGEWLHVPSYIAEVVADNPRRAAAVRGDWAKLKLWGLIEEKPGTRSDGSPRVGYYRLTTLGRRFVDREVKVASHVYIYNGKPMPRTVEEMVSIDDALGKDFNYGDIMAEAC